MTNKVRECVMRPISTEGFEKPKSVSAGAAPMLQWLKIADLVVDPAYQRPIVGNGRRNVDRIARAFSWSCFAPVVVSRSREASLLSSMASTAPRPRR
jgi:hypothetical protein